MQPMRENLSRGPVSGWWIVPAVTVSAVLWLLLGLVVWEAVQ